MNITCSDKHIYSVDEVVKPGVSEILLAMQFIDLYKIPTHELEYARERGKKVHSLTEAHDKGLEIGSVDAQIMPYFRVWKAFVKRMGISMVEIEKPLYSQIWGYCGCLDRVVEYKKELVLWDLKTSTQITIANVLQLTLYKIAYEEMTGKKIKDIWIIKLSEEKAEVITEFKKRKLTDSYFQVIALGMVNCYHCRKANNLIPEDSFYKEIFSF